MDLNAVDVCRFGIGQFGDLRQGAAARKAERVTGLDILAIQDTSEIILGGAKVRAKGYGPVGLTVPVHLTFTFFPLKSS